MPKSFFVFLNVDKNSKFADNNLNNLYSTSLDIILVGYEFKRQQTYENFF